MCGIAGFFGLGHGAESDASHLEAMLSAIEYRGPDEMGVYADGRCGLGNARLSILDAQRGGQPMADESGRYWVVFNGEIFNYLELRDQLRDLGQKFGTDSDTEVLLKALIVWGKSGLARLNAQFAFAFYDRFAGTLLLARDRFGERPLFYWRDGRRIAFGSEIKALFALPDVPRRLSREGLRQACHFWTTLPDTTVFEGIEALPPGHLAEFTAEGFRVSQYFSLPPRQARVSNRTDAADLAASSLRRAVELRMRSDAEVGIYLSGGLDSTITGMLAQSLASKRLRSFSVEFYDKEHDESEFQEAAVSHVGTNHEAVRVSTDDIREHFPNAIWHAECPLFRTAPVPLYLLSRTVSQAGVKVVLTGEGADEFFLGYDIFKEALFLERFSCMSEDEQISYLARLYPYMKHFSSHQSLSILSFYRSFAKQPGDVLLSHKPRFSNGIHAARLIDGEYRSEEGEQDLIDTICALKPSFRSAGVTERAQTIELLTLLNGYLLSSQGDRMTSAHGVEGRYPFLDIEVTGVSQSIDENLLLRDGLDEKYLLKLAFADLPSAIVQRPKQPYRSPGAACFRVAEGGWVADILSQSRLDRSEVLNKAYAKRLVEQVNRTPIGSMSPRLDQAYVSLMSILLLEDLFINTPPVHRQTRLPVKRVLM